MWGRERHHRMTETGIERERGRYKERHMGAAERENEGTRGRQAARGPKLS